MKIKKNKLYKCLPSKDSVGIKFDKDDIFVFFPLGYDIPNSKNQVEEKKAIIDLLRTISLCKNTGEYSNYDYNEGFDEVIPISSYLWVINDYLKNGVYNVIEKKQIQSQKGKINWKRTFKTRPIFDETEIVYLNPIVDIKTINDNIITEIHAICINRSIDQLGWLFGDIPKLDNYKQSLNDNAYLEILNNELSKSFNDRKKVLLKHLIKIIKSKVDDDKLDTVNNLLVNNYSYAWERMIDFVFGNVLEKEKYFPEIKWELRSGKNPKPTMRPDTIIQKNNNQEIYVLDAKYYKYGVMEKGSLPGVESVDKQITYGEYNSKKYNTDNVYNAFIMPFNMNDNLFKSDSPIITIGKVKSVGRMSTGSPYENIIIILMDTKYLIDLYFSRKKKNETLLINSILDELKISQNPS